jgi:hypothetical protein
MIGVLLKRLNELGARVSEDPAEIEQVRRETEAIATQWGRLMEAMRSLQEAEANPAPGDSPESVPTPSRTEKR